MSTATALATPALKSVEVFRNAVSLFRCDYGAQAGAYPFVVTCPDGTVLWGQQLPEATDQQGKAVSLPGIVADKVVITHADGAIEEQSCRELVPESPGEGR
jgi:hypothetical protein